MIKLIKGINGYKLIKINKIILSKKKLIFRLYFFENIRQLKFGILILVIINILSIISPKQIK